MAAVWEHAVDDAHEFILGRVINRRIKSRCGDVFKGEPAMTIAALKEMRLALAERTGTIVK